MGHELKNREILDVGTFNGTEITSEDLDAIVENFEKLKEQHHIPLKFGHDADHNDGQPAIGWITRVFRQGNKLLADFADMPRTVFEAIKNRLYRTVSVELLFNVDDAGNKFNLVLDAVALLGAKHPAVKSLADLDALMAARTEFSGGRRVAFETIAGTTKVIKPQEHKMDEKQIQAMLDKAMAPVLESNAKLTQDLAEERAKTIKLEQDAKAVADEERAKEIKLARDAVTEVLDAAVKARSITPAIRETYEKQIGLSDDDRVTEIKLDEVKTMFSQKVVPDSQTGLEGEGEDQSDPEGLLLSKTVEERQAGETFQAAFMRTAAKNPKLHKAYLDSNGEK